MFLGLDQVADLLSHRVLIEKELRVPKLRNFVRAENYTQKLEVTIRLTPIEKLDIELDYNTRRQGFNSREPFDWLLKL